MHHGTCVSHVPWCMSGSLTCGDGENVPGIPGACARAILRIWQEAHDINNHHTDFSVTTITHDLYYAMHLSHYNDDNRQYCRELRRWSPCWFLCHWRVCPVTVITCYGCPLHPINQSTTDGILPTYIFYVTIEMIEYGACNDSRAPTRMWMSSTTRSRQVDFMFTWYSANGVNIKKRFQMFWVVFMQTTWVEPCAYVRNM